MIAPHIILVLSLESCKTHKSRAKCEDQVEGQYRPIGRSWRPTRPEVLVEAMFMAEVRARRDTSEPHQVQEDHPTYQAWRKEGEELAREAAAARRKARSLRVRVVPHSGGSYPLLKVIGAPRVSWCRGRPGR